MSVEKIMDGKPEKTTVKPIPENLPEELLPLYDWWLAHGKNFITAVAVVVIVGGAALIFKQQLRARQVAANQALVSAQGLDELENTVAKHGSTKAGNAARLRLAKQYYDAGRYEEALTTYDDFLKKGDLAGFTEIAVLGRAFALEGLNRADDALAAYQKFNADNSDHFLKPLAVMGIARALTLKGDKTGAGELLEELKAEKTGDVAWEMLIANLEKVVERYQPRAARSLFEAAQEAAAQLPAPTVVVPDTVAEDTADEAQE